MTWEAWDRIHFLPQEKDIRDKQSPEAEPHTSTCNQNQQVKTTGTHEGKADSIFNNSQIPVEKIQQVYHFYTKLS